MWHTKNNDGKDTMQEAVVLIERWRAYCNTIRPYSSLDYGPTAPESWLVDISLKWLRTNLKTGLMNKVKSLTISRA